MMIVNNINKKIKNNIKKIFCFKNVYLIKYDMRSFFAATKFYNISPLKQ